MKVRIPGRSKMTRADRKNLEAALQQAMRKSKNPAIQLLSAVPSYMDNGQRVNLEEKPEI